ncbi:uncharacterized protein TNCV_1657591 [Trichonephila clavipes]|nr:uncharacterized protein TNCV_1657591 [Trichonephila clavipes]
MYTDDDRRINWRNSEVIHIPNNDRNNYRVNYETGRQSSQWVESRNGFNRDDRRFNDRGYQSGNRVQSENFNREDHRNRGSSTNFSTDLEYTCIPCVDFINEPKIVLDFDPKVLAIPDSQIEKVVTTIEEGNVEIDPTKTGLEESQKQELQDLFSSFKGLFSDKPGLTHVLAS